MNTRVLVIEDSLADLRLLQEALVDAEVHDVDVRHYYTLGEAAQSLVSHDFDVALLDLSLPDTDGLEGLDRIQAVAPELPVLVLTGRDDAELALRAVREGAQDYLIKGNVDGHLLVRAMRYAQERKRVLRELERSEQRFRSLLENALDLIVVLDPLGRITYASPSTERVLGYRPEELTGQFTGMLLHPEDRFSVENAIGGLDAGGESVVFEFRVQRRDGGWRVLEAIGRSLVGDSAVAGVVINARDITERKAAEYGLRELNARLQAVIETCPLPIYVIDLQGRVQGWNRAAQEVFGWTEAEVLGCVLPPASDSAAKTALRERLESARSGGSAVQVESKYRRKNGSSVDVTIWNSPLRDGEGKVTGVVAVVADVTERRRLEEQVRQGQKMEAIGRLAGGVAHDFNNLLTVITGYSQMALNRQPEGSPSALDLAEVLQAADRAATLTKQLLTLSRRKVMEPALLDLNTVVADMQRMLHRVIGEDVQLRTSLWPNLRLVRADRGQLELVLLNLAVNARDAMPGGGTLTIETSEVDLDAPEELHRVSGISGMAVMLSVRDTGMGMDEHVRSHVFEPFFTTKEPGKGTGLGLSTSYGIVRQHAGDISVESEPNVGTMFRVYLPIAASQNPEVVADAQNAPESVHGTETILLVEDEVSVANVMREVLEMHGYRVLVANRAEEALFIIGQTGRKVDLMISDLVLQSEHGVDLARQIRSALPDLRMLFVSGYTGTGASARSFMESSMRFLQKPFTPQVLVAKVREVLSENIEPPNKQ